MSRSRLYLDVDQQTQRLLREIAQREGVTFSAAGRHVLAMGATLSAALTEGRQVWLVGGDTPDQCLELKATPAPAPPAETGVSDE